MNMTAETEVVEEKVVYLLGPKDRCDSCQAEALVWVNGVNGELLFCRHHFNKYEAKLREYAYEIVDEREKLVQNKPIGSAN